MKNQKNQPNVGKHIVGPMDPSEFFKSFQVFRGYTSQPIWAIHYETLNLNEKSILGIRFPF